MSRVNTTLLTGGKRALPVWKLFRQVWIAKHKWEECWGAEPESPGTGIQGKQGRSRTGARLARCRSSQSTVMPGEFKLIPTEIKLV